MRSRTNLSSAGFSLVEVLVALAIVAGLMVGIGALTGTVTSRTARARDAETILTTLIEVEGAALSLGQSRADRLLVALPDRFDLSPDAHAKLTRSDQAMRFELDNASATSRLDLSVFDTASLEYLSPSAASLWSATPPDLAAVTGIRVILRHGSRTWRPLLWLRDRYRP